MPMGHFTMPPEPPRFQGSTDVRAMVELAKAFNDSKFASQIKLLEDHQRACEVAYELAGAAGEIMRLREAAKEAYQKARDTVHDAERQAQRLKTEATAKGEAELVRRKQAMDVTTQELVDKAQVAVDLKGKLNDRQIEIERLSAGLDVRADDLDERDLKLKDDEAKLVAATAALAQREGDLNRRLSQFASLRSS